MDGALRLQLGFDDVQGTGRHAGDEAASRASCLGRAEGRTAEGWGNEAGLTEGW